LRTNLNFFTFLGDTEAIVVTSSMAGEGKSTTASNLALALVEQGARVLLLDADLRRPRIAEIFGIEGSVGLTTILIGGATVQDVVQRVARGSLAVLPAGAAPPNPLQLLDSPMMAELMGELRTHYDTIVINSAPVLPVADASILARLADGAVVVAGAGRTRHHQLRTAIENLEAVGATVMGVVVNGATGKDAGSLYGSDRTGVAASSAALRRRG
ncbi:MAG: CpsD/CapB family tyrosine-protein kinase, partial [Actinomycetota bacterium]|nr:CpsD/CapB family tyrosine-protein kinase [Actinomycetota bacterium]